MKYFLLGIGCGIVVIFIFVKIIYGEGYLDGFNDASNEFNRIIKYKEDLIKELKRRLNE